MANKKTAARKATRKRAKDRLRQDVGSQGVGPLIPPRNYLSLNVAGVTPTIRRTLVWGYLNYVNVAFSALAETLVCKVNSPYDPDNAVGGASATGFAKYMAFYSKCFVLGARVKNKFILCANGGDLPPVAPAHVGVTITTTTGAVASMAAEVEAGLTDYVPVGTSPNVGEVSLGVDVGKFLNKPDILDDPQLFCTSGADPTQLIVAHFWCQNNSAATGLTLKSFYEVEMDCIFTDPITFT